MKSLLSVAIGVLLLTSSNLDAASAQERNGSNERSFDIVKQRRGQVSRRAAIAAEMDDASLAAVTPEQVGDADSFGRKVKYLGLASSAIVSVLPDCTDFDTSFGDRCIPLQPSGQTSFNEADLARIDLPAKASHSLLCFSLTPITNVQFDNRTSAPRPSQLRTAASIVVESPVLNDPALIDPVTGLPFGGQFNLSLSTGFEQRTLAAGATELKLSQGPSRNCIGGLVSKQSLIFMGLTEKQANQFFKNPITLRFGATGSVVSAGFLDYFYGMRVYGD
jgi:hypothetical protein